MEMTIDESLEWLISRKEHYEMDDNCQELTQALDTATDTMRKYKKIEDIYYHQTGRALEDSLRSVIEDGKID